MRWPAYCAAAVLASACLLAPAGADTSPQLPDIFAYRAQDMAALRAGFARPPRQAAPWVHWFWWDGVLSREEISRELAELADAGFAGAELRCVTFHGWSGPPLTQMDEESLVRLGHRRVPYLSDEFIELLAHTCREAKKCGLRLALNMGQGWPPGGTWVADEHRSKHLSWTAGQVDGSGEEFRTPLAQDDFALAWKLDGAAQRQTVEPNSFVDLANHVVDRDGARVVTWDVPPGRWLVGVFHITDGGVCDKGEGPEVDPASREAVLAHLNHFFGRIDSQLSPFYGDVLVDMASDSWEYHRGGQRYWSPEILASFPRLAGYDLREKLHVLLGYGPDIQRVRRDLEGVESALVHQNFFGAVAEFLHRRGLRHRPQVYGRGLHRDLLQAYLLADTPEVEHGILLPEAPWAARLAGKPVVSAEAFTFLSTKWQPVRRRNGPWQTTPALLRWHANNFYAQGVNRIQFHSFSYSPPGLPPPGWRMYAEIHFNRNLPWWWATPALTTWMARSQWLLQAGRPAADALVFPVASNPPEEPYHQLFDLQPASAANGVDGLHRDALEAISRRGLADGYEARVLLLLEPPRTNDELERLLGLTSPAGKLLTTFGVEQFEALTLDQEVRRRLDVMRAAGRLQRVPPRQWRTALKENASVRWAPADAKLVFQRRQVGEGSVYFLVNVGDSFDGWVSFPHGGNRTEIWDADQGRVWQAAHLRAVGERTEVPLELGHFESTAVSFSPGERLLHVVDATHGRFERDQQGRICGRMPGGVEYRATLSDGTFRTGHVEEVAEVAVDGPWQVEFRSDTTFSGAAPRNLTLNELVPWRELADLAEFSGTASYTAAVEMPADFTPVSWAWDLELGSVHEAAQVWVNDEPAGVAWAPPFRLEIGRQLRPGVNTLRIETSNVLQTDSEARDDASRASGLLGPVRLSPHVLVRWPN